MTPKEKKAKILFDKLSLLLKEAGFDQFILLATQSGQDEDAPVACMLNGKPTLLAELIADAIRQEPEFENVLQKGLIMDIAVGLSEASYRMKKERGEIKES